jgi:hypothetical protein
LLATAKTCKAHLRARSSGAVQAVKSHERCLIPLMKLDSSRSGCAWRGCRARAGRAADIEPGRVAEGGPVAVGRPVDQQGLAAGQVGVPVQRGRRSCGAWRAGGRPCRSSSEVLVELGWDVLDAGGAAGRGEEIPAPACLRDVGVPDERVVAGSRLPERRGRLVVERRAGEGTQPRTVAEPPRRGKGLSRCRTASARTAQAAVGALTLLAP